MQRIAPFIAAVFLAGCSPSANNPYAELPDAPLTRARLHAVTLATADDNLPRVLSSQGYTLLNFPTNYPGANRVHAALWGVPEEVAAAVSELAPPAGTGPNLRVLILLVGDREPRPEIAPEVQQAFFRNVLGTEMPRWPDAALSAGAKIQSWSFFVDDVVETSRRLRAAGIPVTFSPVRITTPLLGDHQLLGIRAPDGTLIELVQNASS